MWRLFFFLKYRDINEVTLWHMSKNYEIFISKIELIWTVTGLVDKMSSRNVPVMLMGFQHYTV